MVLVIADAKDTLTGSDPWSYSDCPDPIPYSLVLVLSDLGDSFLVTLAPLPPASQSSPIVRPSCPWSLANTNKSPHQRPCLQFKVICAISQCGCLAEQPLIGTSPRRETVTVRQGPNQLQRFRNVQDISYKSEDLIKPTPT